MARPKVLIPLDGSEFSRQIIGEVRKFFSPDQYDLVLLRVGEPPKGVTGRPTRPASAEVPVPMYDTQTDIEYAQHPVYASQEYESATAKLLDELQSERSQLQSAGYTVYTAAKFGDPGREIVTFISDEDIALVAMTTHGRSGLSRMVSGSVAEHVLRNTNVPVMALRPVEITPSASNSSSQAAGGNQPPHN